MDRKRIRRIDKGMIKKDLKRRIEGRMEDRGNKGLDTEWQD